MDNIKNLSPGTLAFVGDAVYGLMVREHLSKINRPAGELHAMSVKYVNATAQAKAFKVIEPILTEDELNIFKRGRNLHTNNVPKNSTPGEYHTATGFECLFGFLHLSGKSERAREIFTEVLKAIE